MCAPRSWIRGHLEESVFQLASISNKTNYKPSERTRKRVGITRIIQVKDTVQLRMHRAHHGGQSLPYTRSIALAVEAGTTISDRRRRR